MKKVILLAISLFLFIKANAHSIRDTSTIDFKNVESCILQKIKKYGESEVLVVLDIDNTILTSNTDLGGDIWYQWQREKLSIKPTEKQKIKNCFYEDAIGLLYELGTTNLTDESLPNHISNWQNKGVTIFALTSRSPRYRAATERELIKNGIDLSKSALKPSNEGVPCYSFKLERPISYINGIMMTTGMNKGKMLSDILAMTDRSFKSIIFVDDSEKNVIDVKNHFEKDTDIDLTIFHYQKIEQERKNKYDGQVLTKKQARKMAKDWNKLNKALNAIFPGRNQDGECVSPN